jgi:RNA-directed DNA polymerase
MALDPQWEATFEPNSYGFRPGRSAWDAIGAIYVQINQKPKWALDADIAKCFDRIDHNALLKKVGANPTVTRQLRAWLKAGVIDNGKLFPTDEGTPQGGTASPLLANIALHGLEQAIKDAYGNSRNAPAVVRYADDLVVLSPDKAKIEQSQEIIQAWLQEMGLALKPSKTRITHTLRTPEGKAGFDFLGFNIRSYPTKRTRLGFKTIIKPSKASVKAHHRQLRELIARHKTAPQAALIKALNGVIRGWSQYFSTGCSKETYSKADRKLVQRLRSWVRGRHPKQPRRGAARKYWRRQGDKLHFAPANSDTRLCFHRETRIKRHVKIQGNRSPYDGDWVYWSTRLGRHPGMSPRVARLLKRQNGRCAWCGLHFKDSDVLEVDHIVPKVQGGKDVSANWQLLHGHCHDEKTAEDCRRYA